MEKIALVYPLLYQVERMLVVSFCKEEYEPMFYNPISLICPF
jgi:hypothetical protein